MHKHNRRPKATSSWSVALPLSLFLVSMCLSIRDICGLVSCLSVPVSLTLVLLARLAVLMARLDLSKKINVAQVNPDVLIGRYIPNLVAKTFEVSQEYAQLIYDQTSSPRLDKVLKKWDQDNWAAPAQRQKLAYIILVELLSYQFASPVRWIETQDLLFKDFKFERFIEVGPSPTLTGMATRTLKAKYEAEDDSISHTRHIFCHAKNVKEIYYQYEDELLAPEAEAATEAAPASSAAPVAAAAPVAVASSAGPAASIEDAPIKANDVLIVIVAQKLKKKIEEVPTSKSIKDLVGGKSTLQNEILGDLQMEFAGAPDKGEELPLEELGSALGVGYGGSLGKYTSGLVSRMVGGKMPGGFNTSSIKAHLAKTWGLGPARADGVLLIATTMEPAKRLSSEPEAKAWLDTVVAAYAQRAGISLSSGAAAGGGGGGGGGGATINSEEFLKFQADQEKFAAQNIELYMRYLKRDSRAGDIAFDKEKANSAALQAKLDSIAKEHGDTYIEGIQPVFDPLKARHFDSSWNWARQDALLMWYDIIFGRLTTVDREITARCINLLNRADPELVTYMQYYINKCDPTKGENYELAKSFGQQLIDNTREVIGHAPMYKDGQCLLFFFPKIMLTALAQLLSRLHPRQRLRRKATSYTRKLYARVFVNSRPTWKKWPAVTPSLGLSTFRKSRTMFSSFGLSSNRSPESVKNRRIASRRFTKVSSDL